MYIMDTDDVILKTTRLGGGKAVSNKPWEFFTDALREEIRKTQEEEDEVRDWGKHMDRAISSGEL